MTRAEIRIECLKFCNRHDLSAEQILEKAKVFERWVVDTEETPVVNEKPGIKKPRDKKSDTASFLD